MNLGSTVQPITESNERCHFSLSTPRRLGCERINSHLPGCLLGEAGCSREQQILDGVRREREYPGRGRGSETPAGHHGPCHGHSQIGLIKAGFDLNQPMRKGGVAPTVDGASSILGLFLTSCC